MASPALSPALSPAMLKRTPSARSTPVHTPERAALDAELFDTPPELLCPITQAVFAEPVLTASGHVYERSAIEQYLRHSECDPLTRQPLVNKSLTPVFVLKSRAQEYRENAAKQCVELACSRGCPDPVRYLRRAVELVSDAAGAKQDLLSSVRGLSQETVDYVLSHPSNAYDRLALQTFAQGLFQAGYRDRAAAVYYHLLISGSDRVQQARLLRRCLACWSQQPAGGGGGGLALDFGGGGGGTGHAGHAGHAGLPSPRGGSIDGAAAAAGQALPPHGSAGALVVAAGGGGEPVSGSAGTAAAAAAWHDPHVFEKLVLLFEGQAAVSWGQVLDMSLEAGLGEEFVVRLCEQLLFRPMPREGGGSELGHWEDQSPWSQEKEILLKYVKVLCHGVRESCAETSRRLAELEQGPGSGGTPGGASGSSGGASGRGLGARRGRSLGSGVGTSAGGAGMVVVTRPAWLSHPLVVGGCLLLMVLADPLSPAGRLAGAVPVLALLPAS